jgi:hypothetical protein
VVVGRSVPLTGSMKNARSGDSMTLIWVVDAALVPSSLPTTSENRSVDTSFGAVNVGFLPLNVPVPPVTSGPNTWVQVKVSGGSPLLPPPDSVTVDPIETSCGAPALATAGPLETVVKLHDGLVVSRFPAMSVTPVENRAMIVVPDGSALVGVNVTTAPLVEMVPGTGALPVTVKVVDVTDPGATGSENVAVIVELSGTSRVAFTGVVETSVGGVDSSGPLESSPQAASRPAKTSESARGARGKRIMIPGTPPRGV